jgi:hypothetical protein
MKNIENLKKEKGRINRSKEKKEIKRKNKNKR